MKANSWIFLLFCALTPLFAGHVIAQTVVGPLLNNYADEVVSGNTKYGPYTDNSYLLQFGRTTKCRVFLQWTIPNGVIPDNSTIVQARLQMHVGGTQQQMNMMIVRINYDLTSSVTAATLTSAVDTGAHFQSNQPDANYNYDQTFGAGSSILGWIHDQLPQDRFTIALMLPTEGTYDYYYSIPSNSVSLTVWFTPPQQSDTVNQVLSTGQSVGSVGHWETSSFQPYSAPHTFTFDVNSTQYLHADTNRAVNPFNGNVEKYRDWNSDPDVVNHKSFFIQAGTTSITSHLIKSNGATIQAQLIDGGNPGGLVTFKDPWLNDDTSDTKGHRNRGTNAIWHSHSSPFAITTGPTDPNRGVFTNEFFGQSSPYYSIGAQASQTIGSVTSCFLNWSGSRVTFQDASAESTGVVFTDTGATATALYKAHLASNSVTATNGNMQRKVIRDNTGNYYAVYEAGGAIYVTRSTDGGTTWLGEQTVEASDNVYGARNASLAVQLSPAQVGIVYESYKLDNTQHTIGFRAIDVSTGLLHSAETVSQEILGGTAALRPVLAGDGNGWFFAAWYDSVYHKMRGSLREGGGQYWSEADLRSGTMSGLSLAPASSSGEVNWNLVWIQGGNLHYAPIPIGQLPALGTTPDSIVAYGGDDNFIYNPSAVALPRTSGCPAVGWEEYILTSPAQRVIKYREHSDQSGWSTVRVWGATGSNYNTPSVGGATDFTDVSVLWRSGTSQIQYALRKSGTWYAAANLTTGIDPAASAGANRTGQERVIYRGTTGPLYPIGQASVSYGGGLQKSLVAQGPSAATEEGRGGTYVLAGGGMVSLAVSGLAVDGMTLSSVAIPDSYAVRSDADLVSALKTESLKSSGTLTASLTYRANGAVPVGSGFDVALQNAVTGSRLATLAAFRGVGDTTLSVTLPVQASAQQKVRLALIPVGDANVIARQVEHYMAGPASDGAADGGLPKTAEPGSSLPMQFSLFEAYPNPFNPSTTIRFGLPSAGNVSLIIYDVLGREITSLARGTLDAGYHTATWNASSVASGVYFARLTVTNDFGKVAFNKVTKLLLMK
jgi:Secretion system C-terminal sorting domain